MSIQQVFRRVRTACFSVLFLFFVLLGPIRAEPLCQIKLDLSYSECDLVVGVGRETPEAEEASWPRRLAQLSFCERVINRPETAKEFASRASWRSMLAVGDKRLAAQDFEKAMSLGATWQLHLMRALFLGANSRSVNRPSYSEEDAASDVRSAITLAPPESRSLVYAVASLVASEDQDVSQEYINRAIKIDQTNQDFLIMRAHGHYRNGEYAKAACALRETKLESVAALDLLAQSLAALDKHDLVLRVYKAGLWSYVNDQLLAMQVVSHLSQKPKLNRSEKIVMLAASRRACDLTEYKHAQSLAMLGDAYSRVGNPSLAIEFYRRSAAAEDGRLRTKAEIAISRVDQWPELSPRVRISGAMDEGLADAFLGDFVRAREKLLSAQKLADELGEEEYEETIQLSLQKVDAARK